MVCDPQSDVEHELVLASEFRNQGRPERLTFAEIEAHRNQQLAIFPSLVCIQGGVVPSEIFLIATFLAPTGQEHSPSSRLLCANPLRPVSFHQSENCAGHGVCILRSSS